MQKLLQKVLKEHGRVIFNGDNYSQEWHDEAARRGLPNTRTTPEALDAMACDATFQVFETYNVLSRREAESRFEIYREKYVKDVLIEARLCLTMARTMIFPAGVKYQKLLSQTAADLAALGKSGCTTTLDEVNGLLANLQKAMLELESVIQIPAKLSAARECRYLLDTVIPMMNALRKEADALEHICSDELWPLPTYQEMLFIR